MHIYDEYEEEPEEQFLPLPDDLYRELYDLEMASFTDDLPFYLANLTAGSEILEPGCGSGRLSRLLAAAEHRVTGVDISIPMLEQARRQAADRCRFLCMDMRRLAFRTLFDAVVIPYNTLNLLADTADAASCLNGCRACLKDGGKLLLQLFIPSKDLLQEDAGASFQFRVFDRPLGGKIVKETLRHYDHATATIAMTERYKIRPMNGHESNTNFSHCMTLNGSSRAIWLDLLDSTGFVVETLASTYDAATSVSNSLLLVAARK